MPASHAGDPGATPRESTQTLIPWSSGNDFWPTPRQRWFESIRDHSQQDAQVRQPAERLGLNPSVCGFDSRLGHLMTTCPRGAARSARHPVTVEIVGSNPIEDAFFMTRYAIWQSNEAQIFVILWIRFPPVPLKNICVGWALARPRGCNPPASGNAGSTPARRTRLHSPFF